MSVVADNSLTCSVVGAFKHLPKRLNGDNCLMNHFGLLLKSGLSIGPTNNWHIVPVIAFSARFRAVLRIYSSESDGPVVRKKKEQMLNSQQQVEVPPMTACSSDSYGTSYKRLLRYKLHYLFF